MTTCRRGTSPRDSHVTIAPRTTSTCSHSMKRPPGSPSSIPNSRVTLDDDNVSPGDVAAGFPRDDRSANDIDVLALDEALTRLAELDPEHARVVELRYFGGLTVEETAAVMGTSPATVKRQWALARAWLKRSLAQ